MEELAVGRVVHYVLPNGECRKADVVQVFKGNTEIANIYVALDGKNDQAFFNIDGYHPLYASKADQALSGADLSNPGVVMDALMRMIVPVGFLWITSAHLDATKKPGSFHWPKECHAAPQAESEPP